MVRGAAATSICRDEVRQHGGTASPRNGDSRDEGLRAATDGKEFASVASKRMTGGSGTPRGGGVHCRQKKPNVIFLWAEAGDVSEERLSQPVRQSPATPKKPTSCEAI